MIEFAKHHVYSAKELEAMNAEEYYTYLRHELLQAQKAAKKLTKKHGTKH